MYAVIRHTFEIDVSNKYNSYGEWRHRVWLFDTEQEAMTYAITLLDNPMLIANEHYLAHAIETLQTGKFWQVGRESVAVGKVEDKIDIVFKGDSDEKSLH